MGLGSWVCEGGRLAPEEPEKPGRDEVGMAMDEGTPPVGPTVVVVLDAGNVQLVCVVVVVSVRPGQLVAVGLHWVMVIVLVSVCVDVVVVSTSAATRERPAARTARMLLNCIVTDLRLGLTRRVC